jgi:hypothetical protein
MIHLPIKALSVNSGFKGKRYKTAEYKKYERNVLLMLPKMQVGKAPYKIYIEFGLSSRLQDLDNGIKFWNCVTTHEHHCDVYIIT